MTTRRFFSRASGLSLGATLRRAPKPWALMFSAFTPASTKVSRMASARARARSRLRAVAAGERGSGDRCLGSEPCLDLTVGERGAGGFFDRADVGLARRGTGQNGLVGGQVDPEGLEAIGGIVEQTRKPGGVGDGLSRGDRDLVDDLTIARCCLRSFKEVRSRGLVGDDGVDDQFLFVGSDVDRGWGGSRCAGGRGPRGCRRLAG